jgi:hypothetical protein
MMYVVVQQVGVTDKKYLYTVEIKKPGEIGGEAAITIHAIMGNTTESFDAIFKDKRCMSIHEDRLIPFKIFNTLFMQVAITEFRSIKWS